VNISPRIPQPIAAQTPPRWLAVSRGAALGIGFLLTLNFFEILHLNTSPTENWFCSLTPLPDRLALVVIAMAVPSFILFALRPGLPGPVRNALLLIIALLSACTARDCREISMAVPESLLFAAISRPLSFMIALLATAAGLLLGTQRRQSGNLSVLTMLFVATVTAAGFPLACIQSDATFRPLPKRPLLIVPQLTSRSHNNEHLPHVAATTASAWKLHPNSKILLCSHDLPNKPDPLPEQALQLLEDAGVPRKAIVVQTIANSPAAYFEMLRSRPELQKSPPIQLAFAAPGYRLARLKLLARRHGLEPLLIPIGTDAAALESPLETLLECWLMLKHMAEPASEYLHGVRPPAETQIQDDSPPDESIDPGQLLKELQDSAAAEP
jgi:hypothetical protein